MVQCVIFSSRIFLVYVISYKSTKEGLIILDIILLVIRMIMYIVFLMYNLSLSCKLKVVAHNNTHFKHLSLLLLPLVILLVVSFVIVLTWRHEQNTKWRKWKFSAFEFQTTFLEIAHAIYRSMFAYYLVFISQIYTRERMHAIWFLTFCCKTFSILDCISPTSCSLLFFTSLAIHPCSFGHFYYLHHVRCCALALFKKLCK